MVPWVPDQLDLHHKKVPYGGPEHVSLSGGGGPVESLAVGQKLGVPVQPGGSTSQPASWVSNAATESPSTCPIVVVIPSPPTRLMDVVLGVLGQAGVWSMPDKEGSP